LKGSSKFENLEKEIVEGIYHNKFMENYMD